jgi:hypothetical protein
VAQSDARTSRGLAKTLNAMKDYPEGFPLEPIDNQGNKIKEGDSVKVLVIPEWLISGLDDDAVKAINACEGKEMKIEEIDDYGYAWLRMVTLSTETECESHSFSMRPNDLLKLQ